MPTLIHACGAECGGLGNGTTSAAVRHLTAQGATCTIQSGGGLTRGSWSARSFKFAPVAAITDAMGIVFPAVSSPATLVTRFYLYFSTLPDAMRSICSTTNGQAGIRYNPTGTKLETFAGLTSPNIGASGFVPSTGVWYRIDAKFVLGTTTTSDFQVDGSAQAQASKTQSAASMQGLQFGYNANGAHGSAGCNGTYYIDDIATSGTSGDYPLGAGNVVGLFVDADGTHNYNAATDFKYNNSTNVNATSASETGTHNNLQNPLSITVGNFMSQNEATTTEYLEWTFENLGVTYTSINAVELIGIHHNTSGAADTVSLKLEDGATEDTAVSLVSFASTGIIGQHKCYAVAPSTGAAWTEAKVNALKVRWGYSNDVNPPPCIDGLCLEIDGVISGGGVSRDMATEVDTSDDIADAPIKRTQRYIAKVGSSPSAKATNAILARRYVAKVSSSPSAKASPIFSRVVTTTTSNATGLVNAELLISGTVQFATVISEAKNLRLHRVAPSTISGLTRNLQGAAATTLRVRPFMNRTVRRTGKMTTSTSGRALLSYGKLFTVVGSLNKPRFATSAKAVLSTTTTAQGNAPAIPANILAGESCWRSISHNDFEHALGRNYTLHHGAARGFYGVVGNMGGGKVMGPYGGNSTYIKEANGVAVSATGDTDPKYAWQNAYQNNGAPSVNGGSAGVPIAADLTHFRAKAAGTIHWAGFGLNLHSKNSGVVGGPYGDIFNTTLYAEVARQFGLFAGFLKMMNGDGFYLDPEFGPWHSETTTPLPPNMVGKTNAEVCAAYEAWGYQMGLELYSVFPNCALLLYGFILDGSDHDNLITGGSRVFNVTSIRARWLIGLMHGHADRNATGKIHYGEPDLYRGANNKSIGNWKSWHMNIMAYLSQDLPTAVWNHVAPYIHYTAIDWAGSAGGDDFYDNTQEGEPAYTDGLKKNRLYGGGGLRQFYSLGCFENEASWLWQPSWVMIGATKRWSDENTAAVADRLKMGGLPTTLTVKIPPGTGIVNIQLTTCKGGNAGWGGTSATTTNTTFDYGDGGPNTSTVAAATGPSPPVITNITPRSGPAGTIITITGTNLEAPLGTIGQPAGRIAGMVAAANPASQDSSPIEVSGITQSRSGNTVTLTFNANHPHGIHHVHWKLYAFNGTSILDQGMARMVFNGQTGSSLGFASPTARQDCTCVIPNATAGLYVILDFWTAIQQRTSRRVQIGGATSGGGGGSTGTFEVTAVGRGANPQATVPLELTATLSNTTTSAISAPGVGFYTVPGNVQVAWAANPAGIPAGQVLAFSTLTSPQVSPYIPAAAGSVTLRAKPGTGGVDSDIGTRDQTFTIGAAPTSPSGPNVIPFVSTSSWNTRIPTSGVTYSALNFTGGGWVNHGQYSFPLVFGSASDPLVTINAPNTWGWPAQQIQLRIPAGVDGSPGTDGSLIIVDGSTEYNFWQFRRAGPSGTTATVESWTRTNTVTGTGWGQLSPFLGAGIHSTGSSCWAGLLCGNQLTAGINHAIGVTLGQQLSTSQFVGEAIASDGQGGPVPQGARLAIPRNVAMPGGMPVQGQNLWTAFQEYGGFVNDSAPGDSHAILIMADPRSVPDADVGAILGTPLNAISAALRRIL